MDMAATAVLSDTPIQVSEDSVEIESSQIEMGEYTLFLKGKVCIKIIASS